MDGGMAAEDYDRQQAYAEQIYFHPFVRRFLFNTGAGAPCTHFVRRDEQAITSLQLKTKYGPEELGSYAVELTVERCTLTAIPAVGLVLLVFEVAAPATATLTRTKPQAFASHTGLTLADALSIHDTLRRLFPPYYTADGYNGALFPESVEFLSSPSAAAVAAGGDRLKALQHTALELATAGSPEDLWAPWWESLLQPLLGQREEAQSLPRFRQVVDERIPSMMFVALEKESAVGLGDQRRLCFADGPGSGMGYSEEFLGDFRQRHAYTRFSHWGTTYFLSSYSFTCLAGYSERKGESIARDVLQEHFRRHYMRMFFLVQMQKAALLAYSNWMSNAMQGDSRHYRQSIGNVRVAFIKFTHQTWFSNVSNQEQARELFHEMQRHAGNHELYEEVKAESEAAREELEVAAGKAEANNGFILNIVAALFTVLAFPPTVWSPLKEAGYMKPHEATWLWGLMCAASLVSIPVVWWLDQRRARDGMDEIRIAERVPLPYAVNTLHGFFAFACFMFFLLSLNC
jgi:hypothetical protein